MTDRRNDAVIVTIPNDWSEILGGLRDRHRDLSLPELLRKMDKEQRPTRKRNRLDKPSAGS